MTRQIRSRKERLTIEEIRAILDESDDDFSPDESVYDPDSDARSDEDVDDNGDGLQDDSEVSLPDEMDNAIENWHEVTGCHQKSFVFSENCGIQGMNNCNEVIEFFELFLDKDVLDSIVKYTNEAAQRKLDFKKKKWCDVDVAEIKRFLALVMYFGLVQYPSLKKYWSKDKKYLNFFVRCSMPRNRFEDILRFIHFSDENDDSAGRLKKIRDLATLFNKKFQQHRIPGENITIDESVVPFRGRLKFKQYLPGKAHKYGVKLYKACDPDGYTYGFKVYSGKETEEKTDVRHSNKVVLELLENYLDKGRTLIVDNFYTNLEIASHLLKYKTHLVGTLRQNV